MSSHGLKSAGAPDKNGSSCFLPGISTIQYIQDVQLLLDGLGFNGSGNYMGPPKTNPQVEEASLLTSQLAEFNSGRLCGPKGLPGLFVAGKTPVERLAFLFVHLNR
jgi:hypothetical protein